MANKQLKNAIVYKGKTYPVVRTNNIAGLGPDPCGLCDPVIRRACKEDYFQPCRIFNRGYHLAHFGKPKKETKANKTTPFDIPNLDELYRQVVGFVKDKQGEKGYIDCQPFADSSGDIIYAILYDGEYGYGIEHYVYGVRVKDGDLEVLLEPIITTCHVTYKEKDFLEEENRENEWLSVKDGDVYYIPTLFSIAESIAQYETDGENLKRRFPDKI